MIVRIAAAFSLILSVFVFAEPVAARDGSLPGQIPVQLAAAEATVNTVNDPAGKFIDGMGARAIGFLGDEKLSQDQKEAEFRKLLRQSFDMSTIGRFALGRYWKTATPAQKKQYQKLFEDMVVDVYSARFEEYNGQGFHVKSARPDTDSDSIVTSFIVPDEGPQIQVDWRVRKKDGGYKIVDVIIEGVSMALTQRSDFASVIQRGGGNMDVLITHLQDKNAANAQ